MEKTSVVHTRGVSFLEDLILDGSRDPVGHRQLRRDSQGLHESLQQAALKLKAAIRKTAAEIFTMPVPGYPV